MTAMNTPGDHLAHPVIQDRLADVDRALARVNERPTSARAIEAFKAMLLLAEIMIEVRQHELTPDELALYEEIRVALIEVLYAMELMDVLTPEMVEWLEGGDSNHRNPDLPSN
jgi:hypothetical protein